MLDQKTADEIIANNLVHNLFDVISSTMVDKNGIAVDKSLRDIEVVLPISLKGTIENVDEKFTKELERSLKMIKRMGLNRNRGLGRCEFVVKGL